MITTLAGLILGCGETPNASAATSEIVFETTAPSLSHHTSSDAEHASDENVVSLFLGRDESATLENLRNGSIIAVEKGRGGRSLSFRVTFADGTQGYWKPEQTFSGAHFYSEIASYHLDRALAIGRVPPTVYRRLPWGRFRAAAAGDRRLEEIVVGEDGTVRGAMIAWIPEDLVKLRLGRGFERWFRVDSPPSITPFQRARAYAQLASGQELSGDALGNEEDVEERSIGRAGEPDTAERPRELSDMIVFDYLTHNIDRWGGGWTNVRTLAAHGPLIYLDNGAGFIPGPTHIGFMDTRLRSVQKFSTDLLARVDALTLDDLRHRIEADVRAADANEAEIMPVRVLDQVFERRDGLREHARASSRFATP